MCSSTRPTSRPCIRRLKRSYHSRPLIPAFPTLFLAQFRDLLPQIIPRIVEEAVQVITDSESSKEDIVEHLGTRPEKITVIPLGVSPTFRQRIKKADLEATRVRLGLPQRFFLSVSSLEPRKNLAKLVRAYSLLPAEVTDEFKLVLVGAGNRIFADPSLSAELSRLPAGSVVTPGYIADADLPAVYRLSTALVFPSLYEGFGLPVLEAMAASTPVITSNRSSLPEVAGTAAALIDPDSAEQIAAAMELLAEDSGTRNLLVERGKKRAAAFTWEKTAKKTLEVLKAAARD